MFDPSSEQSLTSLFHIGNSIHHLNKRSERLLGLSLVQWFLLKKLIDMPATSPHALSAAVGVHPSTLTQTMKRLEKKKCIYVFNDPRDSRKKQITITRAGKNVLEMATKEILGWSKDLTGLGTELQKIRACLQGQIERKKLSREGMRECPQQ